MTKHDHNVAAHAAYLASKSQGNLHFGRVRVGRKIDGLKSKANKLRLACRGKADAFRSIRNAKVPGKCIKI